MKAILILDEMPECCYECPFYNTEIIPSCWANMSFRGRTIIYDGAVRQFFCPLKPMPEKKDMFCGSSYDIIENRGYNICVDEILGKGEENESDISD